MAKLVITSSFFMRLDIHRHTWISDDGHTRKKIDHILTRDISLIMRYTLLEDANLSTMYSIAVRNRFQTLAPLDGYP